MLLQALWADSMEMLGDGCYGGFSSKVKPEFSQLTSWQGMEQLPIIRINSNINFKRYKGKHLCFIQISKCLSRKLYKQRGKPGQGELSQEQSLEAACRL